jgi:hypothetical protein
MAIIRNAVVKELRRRKITKYRLAKDIEGIHQATVMRWLYSNGTVSVQIAEKILKELDLTVVPRSDSNGGSK